MFRVDYINSLKDRKVKNKWFKKYENALKFAKNKKYCSVHEYDGFMFYKRIFNAVEGKILFE